MALRLKIIGNQIFLPDGVTEYFPCWYNYNQSTLPGDGALLLSWGANGCRIQPNWGGGQSTPLGKVDLYDPSTPDFLNVAALALFDAQIQENVSNGLWTSLGLSGGDDPNNLFWTDPTIRSQFLLSWTSLINKYKDTDYVACFEWLNEPSPHFHDQPTRDIYTKTLYLQCSAILQSIDIFTPQAVGPSTNYNGRNFPAVYDVAFANCIYYFNFYELAFFVKAGKSLNVGYPGYYPDTLKALQNNSGEPYPGEGTTVYMDKVFFEGMLQTYFDFSENFNVPIICDQIGIAAFIIGSFAYAKDICDILIVGGTQRKRKGWAYWVFRLGNRQASMFQNDLSMYYQNADNTWQAKDGTQPVGLSPDSGENWLGMMQNKFSGVLENPLPPPPCLIPRNVFAGNRDFSIYNNQDYIKSWNLTPSPFVNGIGMQLTVKASQDTNAPAILTLNQQNDFSLSGISFNDDFITTGDFEICILKSDIQALLTNGTYYYDLQLQYAGAYQTVYLTGVLTVLPGVGA